jgi:hypothetical protein
VTAGGHILEYGLLPVGALLGGLFAEVIGIRQALLVAAAGFTCGLGWLIWSPIPGLRVLDARVLTAGPLVPIQPPEQL